jgi:outer membrane immunogenic protein
MLCSSRDDGRVRAKGGVMRKLLLGSMAIAAMVGGGPALAADLPVKAPPMVVPVAYSWTGFYVGGNGGYSWGRAGTDLTETSVTTTTATISTLGGTPIASATVVGAPVVNAASDRARVDGWLGGLQAGYNYQVDRWVWGIEGDLQITSERGGTTLCFPLTVACGAAGTTALGIANYSLPWFGTLRGRVGMAWDRVLFYATGGLAYGRVRADYTDAIAAGVITPASFATTSAGVNRAGWVVGAGIEGAVAANWTVKLEYLHLDFGSFSGSTTGVAAGSFSAVLGDFRTTISQSTTYNSLFRTRFTDDILRVGLNYRFSAVAPAVVTKY